MNVFSAELNFYICIIVFIAYLKNKCFYFYYIECNFVSIKIKRKLLKVFIESFVDATLAILDF